MKKSLILFLILNIGVFILSGCKQDSNQTKETVPAKDTVENIQNNDNTQSVSDAEFTYSITEYWIQEEPTTKIRKAQYKIPGVKRSGDAELAIFVFPSVSGAVESNLLKWFEQFTQPDGSLSKDKAVTKEIVINNMPVIIASLKGTYIKPQTSVDSEEEVHKKYALLAAIVQTPTDPWFFKITGPEKTVKKWEPEFNKMVESFNFE